MSESKTLKEWWERCKDLTLEEEYAKLGRMTPEEIRKENELYAKLSKIE